MSTPISPRKDVRGGCRPKVNRKGDSWTNVNTSRHRSERIVVQSDKLKSKAPLIDEPIGSRQLFANWGKGSVLSTTKVKPQSNDGSASSSQRSMSAPVIPQAGPKTVQQLTEQQMKRRISNCLDEFITGNSSKDDFILEINAVVPAAYIPRMIHACHLHALEKSQSARLKSGTLFTGLVKAGKIHLDQYCTGLEAILSQVDDLKIDIPKVWDYLAEILVDLVCEEALPLNRLKKSFYGFSLQGHTIKVIAPLFRLINDMKGPYFLQSIWHKSGLELSDLIPSAQVSSFIRDNELEFLIEDIDSIPVSQNQLSFEQIQNKLSDFLRSKTPLNDTMKWIAANVGDRRKEPKFIRALATAVFEDSISENYKLMTETLAAHSTLLLEYVDYNLTYELQCLYALQALMHKMEHPHGLLLSICDKLYNGGIFSHKSFISWETNHDPAEQEGKGMALKQLTCFFRYLKGSDEEKNYDSSTSDDA